jgi:hypothetical protein
VRGKTASIASGKTLQAVDNGNQDVADAAGLQLVHHLEPEFGALGRLDPEPENVLRSIGCDAKREIDSLVADKALVADPRIKSEDKP